MAKIHCELCGSELVMAAGGKGATCKNCGLEYSIERLREMLMEVSSNVTPITQTSIAQDADKKTDNNTKAISDNNAEKLDIESVTEDNNPVFLDITEIELLEDEVQLLDEQAEESECYELTESSPDDFVLKKRGLGEYRLVNYKGHAQRVTFPNQWIDYDYYMLFADHDEFVELIFPAGYTNSTFVKGNFENKPNLKSVFFGGDVLLGLNEFKGCKKLEHITIENASIIQLGGGSFTDCENLQTLHFCEDAEFDIQAEVFKNCRSLQVFVAPKKSVHFSGEGIESNTFSDCVSLRDVVLPNNIKAIHKDAFKNCRNLKSVATHNGDLSGVAIHPQAFSGSSFQPENIGICPICGKRLQCTSNELTCNCGFSAVQYEN